MSDRKILCQKRLLRSKCAEVFGVDEARMVGGNRLREIIIPRHATCYVLKARFPDLSYPRLGVLMGGRDHSTIIHAVRSTEYRMERDPELAGKIHALINFPLSDSRQHDAHIRQWAAFRMEAAALAATVVVEIAPAPAAIDLGEELAEFIDPEKVFCGQCDRAVSDGERRGCRARLCSLRAAPVAFSAARERVAA